LKREGLKRRIVLDVPSFMTALAVVAESDLLATVPAHFAATHARGLDLQSFKPPVAIRPFAIVAARHARSRGDPALDWLVARIENAVSLVQVRIKSQDDNLIDGPDLSGSSVA
jgi:DNA-binding transcriptional LysR family regulator